MSGLKIDCVHDLRHQAGDAPLYVGRRDGEGYAHAPQGTWLGICVDWPAVETASFLTYELTTVTCSGKISEGETR
jgi:hypothetical protein